VMLALAVLAAGCATATVDKQSARATAVAPESTQVDVVRVPYDPSLPYYVVVVEPFTFDADGSPASSAPRTPGTRYGWGPFGWGLLPEGPRAEAYNPPPQGASERMGVAIANQLVTALGNAGNVRIIDTPTSRATAARRRHSSRRVSERWGRCWFAAPSPSSTRSPKRPAPA